MTDYLATLSAEDFAALERCGRRRRWRRGATLFSEGDRSDWVAALLCGRVKVCSYSESGTESVLAIREPGALLGELSALDELPRSATVLALEPVEALVVCRLNR